MKYFLCRSLSHNLICSLSNCNAQSFPPGSVNTTRQLLQIFLRQPHPLISADSQNRHSSQRGYFRITSCSWATKWFALAFPNFNYNNFPQKTHPECNKRPEKAVKWAECEEPWGCHKVLTLQRRGFSAKSLVFASFLLCGTQISQVPWRPHSQNTGTSQRGVGAKAT